MTRWRPSGFLRRLLFGDPDAFAPFVNSGFFLLSAALSGTILAAQGLLWSCPSRPHAAWQMLDGLTGWFPILLPTFYALPFFFVLARRVGRALLAATATAGLAGLMVLAASLPALVPALADSIRRPSHWLRYLSELIQQEIGLGAALALAALGVIAAWSLAYALLLPENFKARQVVPEAALGLIVAAVAYSYLQLRTTDILGYLPLGVATPQNCMWSAALLWVIHAIIGAVAVSPHVLVVERRLRQPETRAGLRRVTEVFE